jgi:hypothetical protein
MTKQVDPFLDQSLKGWIINKSRREFWRIAAWYSVEDLIQDGYMVYYKCRNRYSHLTDKPEPTIDDKRQFMALFKVSFHNFITDLANDRTATPEEAHSEAMLYAATAGRPQQEEATFRLLLASAPKEIAQLVELLMTEGSEKVAYLRSRFFVKDGEKIRRRRSLWETTNQHYCRRLGLDATKVDLMKLACDHFCMD